MKLIKSNESMRRRARETSMEFQGASVGQILRLQKQQRHSMEIFTPKKQKEEPPMKMSEYEGLLVLRQLFTQRAYKRVKYTLRSISKKFDILPPLDKVLN